MSTWLQRLLTYLAAAATAVSAHFCPDSAATLLTIAGALAGWATPHPADNRAKGE